MSIRRSLQDHVVLYFGSVIFKIGRLTAVAALSVHFFACAFYRVKIDSADKPEDVEDFYLSRGVEPTVREAPPPIRLHLWQALTHCICRISRGYM